jgi:hypothetical protein
MARLIEEGTHVSVQELYFAASFYDNRCITLIAGPCINVSFVQNEIDEKCLKSLYHDVRIVKSFVTVGEL